MSEILSITTERVDDIPLLLAQMQQMHLPDLLDSYFAVHGNWQGLGPGWLTTIWLAHVLSQADHRLSYVQPWVEAGLLSLQQLTAQPIRPLDFSDDRLARLLELFSQDDHWHPFEAALNRNLLRVYDLPATRVRCDSTSASGYWQVDAEGLFQFGRSNNGRPDLPQLKVMLATLDPHPLPLATNVLPGQRADDPLYCPLIQRVRSCLGQRGLLYVGDSKMATLATRALVQAGQDYYLCPLPQNQLPPEWPTDYLADVLADKQPLTTVERQRADGKVSTIAVGYERTVHVTATLDGQLLRWQERRLVVRSLGAARTAEQAVRDQLAAAQQQLGALAERKHGRTRPADRAALDQAIAAILERYPVGELLHREISEQWHVREVRGYKGRPARVEQRWDFRLSVAVDEQALQQRIAGLGWRVFATNQSVEELPLEQALLAYWDEYLIEQSFGRLKGAPLSLSPLYLQRDDHAKGLVRLLSLGVRVLALLECVVRRRLATGKQSLSGLQPGQPQRSTTRPTSERLLASMRGLTLTIIAQTSGVRYHLTPLSELQSRIVELAGFSTDIYTKLVAVSTGPPGK